MRTEIPKPLIGLISQLLGTYYTHAEINQICLYADAFGDEPGGNKINKTQQWLINTNKELSYDPLKTLGKILEEHFLEPQFPNNPEYISLLDKIKSCLEEYSLTYIPHGKIIYNNLSQPTKNLEEKIREIDIPSLTYEFERALENINNDLKESISAASNILETICKVYIEDEQLEKPKNLDLKSVFEIVRNDLNFKPQNIEDQDLKQILSGIISVVQGIASLRTHSSSAHGQGKKTYQLEPRHARLAVHSAHTIALFILETWDKKKQSKKSSL